MSLHKETGTNKSGHWAVRTAASQECVVTNVFLTMPSVTGGILSVDLKS